MYYKKTCRKGGENFIKYEKILDVRVEKLQARRREKLYSSTKNNIVPVGSFKLKREKLIFSESFVKLSLFLSSLTC